MRPFSLICVLISVLALGCKTDTETRADVSSAADSGAYTPKTADKKPVELIASSTEKTKKCEKLHNHMVDIIVDEGKTPEAILERIRGGEGRIKAINKCLKTEDLEIDCVLSAKNMAQIVNCGVKKVENKEGMKIEGEIPEKVVPAAKKPEAK